jgi:hypothetical protein
MSTGLPFDNRETRANGQIQAAGVLQSDSRHWPLVPMLPRWDDYRVTIMRLATLASMLAVALLPATSRAACQVISEVEAEYPLVSTSPPFGGGHDINGHLALTFGWVKKNVSSTSAWGITGSLMSTQRKPGARAEVRYRLRNGRLTAFRASAGIEKWEIRGPSYAAQSAHGLTASAGVERSTLGVHARVDLLRTADRGVSAFSVGGQLGGKPGRIIVIATAVLGAAFFVLAGD